MKKLLLLLFTLIGISLPSSAEVADVVFDYTTAYSTNNFTGYFINSTTQLRKDVNGLMNFPTTIYSLSKKITVGVREYEVLIEFTDPSPATFGPDVTINKNQYSGQENNLKIAGDTQFRIYVRNAGGEIAGDIKSIRFYSPQTYRSQLFANIKSDGTDPVLFSDYGSNPPSYKWWRPTANRPVQIAMFKAGTTKVSGYIMPVEISKIELSFETTDYRPFTPYIEPRGGHVADESNNIYFINNIDVDFRMHPEDVAGGMDMFLYTPGFNENINTPPRENQYLVNNGHTINVSEPTTLWLYSANSKSWSYYSAVNEKIFNKLKANEFETIESLTNIISGKAVPAVNANERQMVTFSDTMLVDGVYKTDQGNIYVFLHDRKDGWLRAVSAVDVPLKSGQLLAPRGIAGRYMHNGGTPEIEITDFIKYCAVGDTVSSTANFPEIEIRYNRELPEGKTIIDDSDFNSHLILSHLQWQQNNYVKDRNGNRYLVYPRFIDHVAPEIRIDDEVRIDCYVSKTARELILIPLEITVCAETPYVRYESGNRISGLTPVVFTGNNTTIDWIVEENPELNYSCRINGGEWQEPCPITQDMFITADDGKEYCDLEVVSNISDEYDPKTSSSEKIRFVKENATEVASIYEFNHLFLNDNGPIPGKDLSGYYLIKGEVVIEEDSKYNLFVRDNTLESGDAELGQQYHIILHNPNSWSNPEITEIINGKPVSRPLKVGDIITSFVIKPEITDLGMFRGNAEGFAPTYTLADNQTAVPETTSRTLKVSYDDKNADTYYTRYNLEPKNRMMHFRFENVKIDCIDNPDYATAKPQPDGTRVDENGVSVDEHIYRMVVGSTLNIRFDVFPEHVGGFIAAYDPESTYTIEAIVVSDPKSIPTGYSMALTEFEGNGITSAPVKMYIDGEEDTEPDEDGVIEFIHSGVVKIELPEDSPENTAIYYTTDGTDPKMSIRPKRYNSAAGILLSDDNKLTTVRAFAVQPGSTPSPEFVTVFRRLAEETPYIVHLITYGKPDVPYHFNGNMRIVAKGGNHIFVRGTQGNFLPIRREEASTFALSKAADVWNSYKVGQYISDLIFEADYNEDGLLKGAKIPEKYLTYLKPGSDKRPETLSEDIAIDPDETADRVSKADESNLRRLVAFNNCQLVELSAGEDEDPEWLMIPDNGDAVEHAMVLNVSAIDYPMSADLDIEHNYFNITGFVMLDEFGDPEIWPVNVTKVEISDGPEAEFDGNAIVSEEDDITTVMFYPATKVMLTYNGKNAANATIRYYLTDFDDTPENDAKWNVYGQPFTVSENCYLHAVVDIPGMVTSAHTHVKFYLTQPSADVDFVVSRSGNTSKVALVPAVEIPADSYTILYSTDGSEPALEYSEPFNITETTSFLARVMEKDKTPGRICKAVISAGSTGGIQGLVHFKTIPQASGPALIELLPKENLPAGTYKIYYTTDPGVLPTIDPDMLYTKPFPAPESGIILAIIVQNNTVQGEVTTMNVWDVTGIDSVASDGSKSVTVNGNTIIAPEGAMIYNTAGQPVGNENLRKGIYIVRLPGKKSVKVIIK